MTAKGVKRYVIKNKLTHDNFKNVIKKKDRMRHKMNTIRSTKHVIGTYQIQKVTLSCFDDKIYLLDDEVTSFAYGNRRIVNDTVEVPIVEACDSDKWVHTPEEYTVCEPVIYESEPVVAVVIEEETVRLSNPKVEYIEPHHLFFLKVITFRRAERKLGFIKKSSQLQRFGWSTEKVTQYMSESERPLICEFNKEELDRCREGLMDRGRSEEDGEDEIRRKVYESKEKLIRRYEDYLGIREDTGGNQVRTYRRWLRETSGYNDKKIEELVSKKFNLPIIKEPKDLRQVAEKDKLKSIFEIEEELIRKYMQDDDSARVKEKHYESKFNTVREHVDPKIKHTKKDHKRSKHKHKSHKHKSKHTVT
jgi:hypothetical protein